MNTFAITITTLIVGLVGSAGVHAANDIQLQRLGICQDRWVDWKDDAVRLERFENFFKTEFEEMAPDGAFVPKLPTRVFGWPVVHRNFTHIVNRVIQ